MLKTTKKQTAKLIFGDLMASINIGESTHPVLPHEARNQLLSMGFRYVPESRTMDERKRIVSELWERQQ